MTCPPLEQAVRVPVRNLMVLALLVTLSGCVPQGLAFREDTRLTIVAPEDRSTVSLPVTLDWDIRDFRVVEPGRRPGPNGEGYFGVFVDVSPVPPGKQLAWIARKDRSCVAADGCPSEAYLAERGVYATTSTQLTLDNLLRRAVVKGVERHRATIVLLDAGGARLGESAFEVTFYVKRKAQS